MSNTSNRKLRSLLQSRSRIALFVAILLLTCGLHASRTTSASSTDTVVVTPDVATAPLVPVSHQVIDDSPWDQLDTHIDCNLVSYVSTETRLPKVKYFDFLTNTGGLVPSQDREETLHADVSGTRIAYTNITINDSQTEVLSQIKVFDTSTNSVVTVPGGTERRNPSIVGDLVAFEDHSFLRSEIVVYNLATGVTTRLTNDSESDFDPVVAPTGDAVVYIKCTSGHFGCDVYSAIQSAPGVFTVSQLTGPTTNDENLDTNGSFVVYESTSGEERDIAYQPIAGGVETRIALPGDQRNPNIVGNVISFDSERTPFSFDLFVYQITANQLYRVTDTPVSELLNDITLCGDQFRVAYTTYNPVGVQFDVHAVTFQLPDTPSDQVEDVIDVVTSFDLPDGLENSLVQKLQNALDALDANDTATACDALHAFTNQVIAQSGKKIPTSQADQLINSANQIKQTLGCQ